MVEVPGHMPRVVMLRVVGGMDKMWDMEAAVVMEEVMDKVADGKVLVNEDLIEMKGEILSDHASYWS